MPASAEMIWDSALSLLRRRVTSETGNLWFQPVRATDLTHDCITLEVADEFSSAWLAERHLGVLREVLSQAAHRPLEVRFQVGAGGVMNGLPAPARTSGNSEAERPGAGTPASPRTGGFTSSYRFDSFVVGAGNDFAHAAIRRCHPRRPRSSSASGRAAGRSTTSRSESATCSPSSAAG